MGAPGRDVEAQRNYRTRPFSIHSSNRFALSEAATAHRALQHRHLVRMILTID